MHYAVRTIAAEQLCLLVTFVDDAQDVADEGVLEEALRYVKQSLRSTLLA